MTLIIVDGDEAPKLVAARGPESGEEFVIFDAERTPWEQVKRDGIDYIALYYVNEEGKQVQIWDAELA